MPHEPGRSVAEWTPGLDASERSDQGDANSRRRLGSIPQERGHPLRSSAPEDGSRPAAWSSYSSCSNMAGGRAQRVGIQSQDLRAARPRNMASHESWTSAGGSPPRVLEMKANNGLLLTILPPEVTGNPAVVFIHLPVALPPVVELAGGDVEPPNELPGADHGSDDLVICGCQTFAI